MTKKDVVVQIDAQTRMTYFTDSFLGLNRENLQGNIIFEFLNNMFVEGEPRLEVELDKKYVITELTRVDDTYVVPIKSSLLTQSNVLMQLVIVEPGGRFVLTKDTTINPKKIYFVKTGDETYERVENPVLEDISTYYEKVDIPKFKSNEFTMHVSDSINAEVDLPEEYETLLDQIQEAIAETNNLDIDAEKVDNIATITITKKDGSTKEVEIRDGEKGETGEQGIQGPKGDDGQAGRDGYVQYTAGDNIIIENNVISATGGGTSEKEIMYISNDIMYLTTESTEEEIFEAFGGQDKFNEICDWILDDKTVVVYYSDGAYHETYPTYASGNNNGLMIYSIFENGADELNLNLMQGHWKVSSQQTYRYATDLSNYYTKTQTNSLLNGKQDELVAGDNIGIVDNEISVIGLQPIIINASTNTTINGYQVPSLTTEQITQTYNGIVSGKEVVVADATGNMHFKVNQADTDTDDLFISFIYYDIMILQYNGDETITYKEISGGGASTPRYTITLTTPLTDTGSGSTYLNSTDRTSLENFMAWLLLQTGTCELNIRSNHLYSSDGQSESDGVFLFTGGTNLRTDTTTYLYSCIKEIRLTGTIPSLMITPCIYGLSIKWSNLGTGAKLYIFHQDLKNSAYLQKYFLGIDNTEAFTPTNDYHPSTKKYVDDSIASAITDALGGNY